MSNVIIRQLEVEDIDKAIPLFEEFCKESLSDYGIPVDVEHLTKLANIYKDNTLIIESGDKLVGIISGAVVDMPAGGKKVYQELVWYVLASHRRYGIKLLNTLEEKCKKEGIDSIIMSLMQNSKSNKLENFYNKRGFRLVEKQYIKQVGG